MHPLFFIVILNMKQIWHTHTYTYTENYISPIYKTLLPCDVPNKNILFLLHDINEVSWPLQRHHPDSRIFFVREVNVRFSLAHVTFLSSLDEIHLDISAGHIKYRLFLSPALFSQPPLLTPQVCLFMASCLLFSFSLFLDFCYFMKRHQKLKNSENDKEVRIISRSMSIYI